MTNPTRSVPRGPGRGQDPTPTAVPWILPNPGDDPAIIAALDSAQARARRILLIRLSPISTTVAHLMHDTLRALGLGVHDIEAQEIDPERLPRLLTHRLCGMRVAVVAIDCPHPLTAVQLRCLQRWCDHLAAQLVLITAGEDTVPLSGLATSLDRVLRSQPEPRDPEKDADWPADLDKVTLPADEFTTFRTTCLTLLPEHARAIDDVYVQTFDQVRRELQYQRPEALVACAKAAMFHVLTRHDPPAAIRLIALRATQAALFTHHRLLLSWNPVTPPHAPRISLPGSLAPHQHALALDRVLDPLPALDNLLTGLFELDSGNQRLLRRDQLVLDTGYRADFGHVQGPALVSGDMVLRFPAWTHQTLHAYRCARDHHDHPRTTSESDLLFPGDIQPLLGRSLGRRVVYRPTDGSEKDTNHFPYRPFPGDPDILHTWRRRRHLTLTALTDRPPSQTLPPQPDRGDSDALTAK